MSIQCPAPNLEDQGVSHCMESYSSEGHISVQFKAGYIEEHVFIWLYNIYGLKLTKLHKLLAQEMDYDSPRNHS